MQKRYFGIRQFFLPHLLSASGLPRKTENTENRIFSLFKLQIKVYWNLYFTSVVDLFGT